MLELNLFARSVINSLGNPVAGAKIRVYPSGATVTSPVTCPAGIPTVVGVNGVGSVRVGQTVMQNADATRTGTVTAVSRTTRQLTINSPGGIGLNGGDRLVVKEPPTTLYVDEEGVTPVAADPADSNYNRTIVTNGLGYASAYARELQVDFIITLADNSTLVVTDHALAPLRIFTLRGFGGKGDGSDERDLFINVLDEISARGGGGLLIDPTGDEWGVDGALSIPDNVSLYGQGPASSIRQLNASAHLLTGTNLTNVTLTNLALRGRVGGTGRLINVTSSVNSFRARGCVFAEGEEGIIAVAPTGMIFSACEFSAFTRFGLVGLQPTGGGMQVLGCSFTNIGSVASDASVLVSPNGQSGKGHVTILGCAFVGGSAAGVRHVGLDGGVGAELVSIVLGSNRHSGGRLGVGATYCDSLVMSPSTFASMTTDVTLDAYTLARFVGALSAGGIADSVARRQSGAPADSPIGSPMRFDTATKRLWIYDGAAWRYVVLT